MTELVSVPWGLLKEIAEALILQASASKKEEQMTGIEPASSAWEADVLPMNYICNMLVSYHDFPQL